MITASFKVVRFKALSASLLCADLLFRGGVTSHAILRTLSRFDDSIQIRGYSSEKSLSKFNVCLTFAENNTVVL